MNFSVDHNLMGFKRYGSCGERSRRIERHMEIIQCFVQVTIAKAGDDMKFDDYVPIGIHRLLCQRCEDLKPFPFLAVPYRCSLWLC